MHETSDLNGQRIYWFQPNSMSNTLQIGPLEHMSIVIPFESF